MSLRSPHSSTQVCIVNITYGRDGYAENTKEMCQTSREMKRVTKRRTWFRCKDAAERWAIGDFYTNVFGGVCVLLGAGPLDG
jgi:hypothetical protein